MAFASLTPRSGPDPVADINLVPLIDVLLVLLVVLLVSAPLVTSAVRVDLPRLAAAPPTPPERLTLKVQRDGALQWQGQDADRTALRAHLVQAAARTPAPLLAIEADAEVPYRVLAEVMSDAGQAGLSRLAFVGLPATATAAAPPVAHRPVSPPTTRAP